MSDRSLNYSQTAVEDYEPETKAEEKTSYPGSQGQESDAARNDHTARFAEQLGDTEAAKFFNGKGDQKLSDVDRDKRVKVLNSYSEAFQNSDFADDEKLEAAKAISSQTFKDAFQKAEQHQANSSMNYPEEVITALESNGATDIHLNKKTGQLEFSYGNEKELKAIQEALNGDKYVVNKIDSSSQTGYAERTDGENPKEEYVNEAVERFRQTRLEQLRNDFSDDLCLSNEEAMSRHVEHAAYIAGMTHDDLKETMLLRMNEGSNACLGDCIEGVLGNKYADYLSENKGNMENLADAEAVKGAVELIGSAELEGIREKMKDQDLRIADLESAVEDLQDKFAKYQAGRQDPDELTEALKGASYATIAETGEAILEAVADSQTLDMTSHGKAALGAIADAAKEQLDMKQELDEKASEDEKKSWFDSLKELLAQALEATKYFVINSVSSMGEDYLKFCDWLDGKKSKPRKPAQEPVANND